VEKPHKSRVDETIYRNRYFSEIRKGKLRWLGHVERTSEKRIVKKMF
jgi:hypothetical protein